MYEGGRVTAKDLAENQVNREESPERCWLPYHQDFSWRLLKHCHAMQKVEGFELLFPNGYL